MKRLVIAVLGMAALGIVVAGSALASGTKTSVIYDSTAKNGPPSNLVSAGPEAYAFTSIGDTISFVGTARTLTNATVTLSSWGCVSGTWYAGTCSTPTGATFSQPITLTVGSVSVTTTFNVSYRPSASSKCTTDGQPDGRWYSSGLKSCFNGFAQDVTFNLPNIKVGDNTTYAISYNTSGYGPSPLGYSNPCNSTSAGCPYDSLNVALNDTTNGPIIGTPKYNPTETVFGYPYTPAVQFKASNAS